MLRKKKSSFYYVFVKPRDRERGGGVGRAKGHSGNAPKECKFVWDGSPKNVFEGIDKT